MGSVRTGEGLGVLRSVCAVLKGQIHCTCSVPGIEHLRLAGRDESSLLHLSELQNLDWKRCSLIIESNHLKGL